MVRLMAIPVDGVGLAGAGKHRAGVLALCKQILLEKALTTENTEIHGEKLRVPLCSLWLKSHAQIFKNQTIN